MIMTMLRPKILFVLTLCIGILIGAMLVWTVLRPSIPSSWFEINANSQTSMSTEAFTADIPLADVVSLKGRSRFINHDSTTSGDVGIGYFLDIELSRIDPEKIPKKYAVEKKIPGSKLSESPVTVPNYVIQFIFDFRDKDGFSVAKITGPEHIVDSGKINKITGQTKQDFPRRQAELVRSVTVSTYFKTVPNVRAE